MSRQPRLGQVFEHLAGDKYGEFKDGFVSLQTFCPFHDKFSFFCSRASDTTRNGRHTYMCSSKQRQLRRVKRRYKVKTQVQRRASKEVYGSITEKKQSSIADYSSKF